MLVRLLAAALLLATQAAAAPATMTAAQWHEDLRVLKTEIETRHPAPYNRTSKAELDAAIANLDRRIPTLGRNQIITAMMRIVAMVGDGHTRIDPRKDPAFGFPSLPIKLYDFDDGLFVRAAAPGQAALIGWRVEAVGGVPVDEAVRRVDELISSDNAMGKRQLAPLYLAMPDVLQALGLSARRDSATLTFTRGKQSKTVTLKAAGVSPPWPPDTDISLTTPAGWADACPTPPLYLQNLLDYHRLAELDDGRVLYAQLNWVADLDSESLDQFAKRIFETSKKTNPKALVLDLRFDQGGNGNLRNGLVASLIRAEDSDTRLFVLVGRGTFSASQFILNDLDRLTGAVFVGEPASSKPSSYGDAYKTILPNSGIAVRTSIYWWQDEQNFDPYTWIDVAAPLTFADYAACRDRALEAVLSYRKPEPLEETLFRAARAGGLASARQAVREYLGAKANRYANVDFLLPRAAETVFRNGHKAEALGVARAVAEALPRTADAWLVLAYVALENSDKATAIAAGERVIRLDPNNRVARDLVAEARKAGGG